MPYKVPIAKGRANNPPRKGPRPRVRGATMDVLNERFMRQAEEAVRISFLAGITKFKRRLSVAKLSAMFLSGDYAALRETIPWDSLADDLAPVARELAKILNQAQARSSIDLDISTQDERRSTATRVTYTPEPQEQTSDQATVAALQAVGFADIRRDEVNANYLKDADNPRAVALAQDRVGKYLQDLAQEGRQHVADVTAAATRDGQTQGDLAQTIYKELAKNIQSGVGLNRQQKMALNNAALADVKAGMTPTQVQARKDAYADRLLRQRAQTIAVTETRVVANATETLSWQAQAEDGLLDPGSRRVWVTEPDCCDVCVQLSGVAVGLYEDWVIPGGASFPQPPAHPRCRCLAVLMGPKE